MLHACVAAWIRSSHSSVNRVSAAFQCSGRSHFLITLRSPAEIRQSIRFQGVAKVIDLHKVKEERAKGAGA